MMTSLITLIARAEQHDNDLKELREQVNELSALIKELAEDDQRDREATEAASQAEQQLWKDTEREIEHRLKKFEGRVKAAGR